MHIYKKNIGLHYRVKVDGAFNLAVLVRTTARRGGSACCFGIRFQ